MEININNAFINQPMQKPLHKEKDEDDKPNEEKFAQKAKSLGVPEYIINQGRKAVEEWVMENKDNSEGKHAVEKTEVEKQAEMNASSDYKVSIYV